MESKESENSPGIWAKEEAARVEPGGSLAYRVIPNPLERVELIGPTERVNGELSLITRSRGS